MKRFVLRYLLSNREVLNEVIIDLLRYLADQTDTDVDDVLVDQLAEFIAHPAPRRG